MRQYEVQIDRAITNRAMCWITVTAPTPDEALAAALAQAQGAPPDDFYWAAASEPRAIQLTASPTNVMPLTDSEQDEDDVHEAEADDE